MVQKPSPRFDALVERVERVCGRERGRKKALAEFVGARPHMLSEWLKTGKQPTAEYTLAILEWLEGVEQLDGS